MININLTISITLNVIILNIPREIVKVDKENKTQLYNIYRTFSLKTHKLKMKGQEIHITITLIKTGSWASSCTL
jgi:hypothetical protein